MNPTPPKVLPPEVISALQQGNFIGAIKLLRAAGGIDLQQAKAAIEQHIDKTKAAATRAVGTGAVGTGFDVPEVTEALKTGNKIEAIRILREKTGLGLAEAKEAVERQFSRYSSSSTSSSSSLDSPAPVSTPTPYSGSTIVRPGLSPGEVPHAKGGRWWIAVVIVIGAVIYYVLSRQ